MKTAGILLMALLLGRPVIFAQSKQTREVKNFTTINASSAIQVVLTLSDSESLEFEAEDKVLEDLVAEVNNGELILKVKKDVRTDKKIIAYVKAKKLEGITVSGAAEVKVNSPVTAGKFSINASGAGHVTVELKATSVDADLSGASHTTIKGSSDNLKIRIEGAAHLNADDFDSKSANLNASGASHVNILARQSININASGASKITYKGSPKDIIIDSSGAASVKKAG
jgi:hypothetical protein